MAQAISRTSSTAPSSTASAGRTFCTSCCCRGVTLTPTFVFVSGYSRSRLRAICAMSARAFSIGTPSFSRASGKIPGCQPRSSGSVAAHGPSGITTSAGCTSTNPGGRMPTIVRAVLSTIRRRPTARGSRPKRRLHSPSLMRATGSPPAASSPFVKARPCDGVTPSIGSIPAVTILAGTRSGSSCPVSVTFRGRYAATNSNERLSSRQST